jgi:serine/threonine protein kinase
MNVTCTHCRQQNPVGTPVCFACGGRIEAGLTPGQLIQGRYLVQRTLGLGGFGATYLVEDNKENGRLVVLKELILALVHPQAVQAFEREAAVLEGLVHERIPRFYGYFEEVERCYLVQQHVPGKNLKQYLEELGPFEEEAIIAVLIPVLETLDYLHHLPQPVIHRDIKPENIMRTGDGRVFLVDFGAVKAVIQGAVPSRTNANIYTAGYAPPEQTHGARVFPSSDLYALGASAIHLLTGTHPSQLFDPAYMAIRWSADVSLELRHILEKMTQPTPVARYPKARDALADLRRLVHWGDDEVAAVSAAAPAAANGLAAPPATAPVASSGPAPAATPAGPGAAHVPAAAVPAAGKPAGAVSVAHGVKAPAAAASADPAAQPAAAPLPGNVRQAIETGWALCSNRDFQDAIREFQEAARLWPSAAEAFTGLAYAYSQLGQDDPAMRACREAIRLNAGLSLAHSIHGDLLFHKGDAASAIREYREAIRIEPNDGPTHTSLGDALLEVGDREGAIAEFREAIRCDPADPQAHNQLGHALWDMGDFSGAIWEFCEAIRIDPNYAWAHQNLGRALAKQNDLEGAIREYREALRCDPNLLQARLELGDALASVGNPGDAVREYREALRIDPNNRYARQQMGIALTKKIDKH